MAKPYERAADYIWSIEGSVEQAGTLARERYRTAFETKVKSHGDIVTDVDTGCEEIIVGAIRRAYPGHRIISEEIGEIGQDSEWTWIVDPLDGTHNYVVGLPLFGMIVSLFHSDEPVAAILHDAYQSDTVIGAAGSGVYFNGKPLRRLSSGLPPKRETIGWTQGYAVQDDPVARAVRDRVEQMSKRLIATWAPVIDTIRLVNGQFGAIVSFDGEITDLSAARALVPEIGGVVRRFSRGGADRRFIVGPVHTVDVLCAELRDLVILPR